MVGEGTRSVNPAARSVGARKPSLHKGVTGSVGWPGDEEVEAACLIVRWDGVEGDMTSSNSSRSISQAAYRVLHALVLHRKGGCIQQSLLVNLCRAPQPDLRHLQ